ncbi:hypothetical protein [Mucilaginibacter arboris]|uniref:Tetratricopeptide repeat protein n=1 Tax=Mucilaginibacter arboris TaxID=2682090 RepID=A0A7K1SWZ6_9SPHI|nr:hypothetical protein [Mucilaginibacter arboris]MVN21839.1 hypothetical protein [Mucilaginibacter arboris]
MTWLSELFGKKKERELSLEEKEQLKRKWDRFDLFQKGKDCYLKRQTDDALLYFDKALEYNFIENFPTEVTKLFGMRGCCLQELDYDYDAINNFDKSITLASNDCNKYFSRSVSKGAILDFEGEIADIEKAIELSKIDNLLNREYNDEAQKQGYKNGVAGLFEMRLVGARMKLETELNDRKRIENASTLKDKLFWQEMFDEKKAKMLSRIKKRN